MKSEVGSGKWEVLLQPLFRLPTSTFHLPPSAFRLSTSTFPLRSPCLFVTSS
ncbi:MAG: hypothetical protein H6566_25465 [Lewinellaceae bacterium]|nr:hypothetical protein [Lewinellaceae bacterium]